MAEPQPGEVALLEFRLGGKRFGIACELVVEMLPLLPVHTLPGAPAVLLGVASVRWELLPLLDPRPRLGLPRWTPCLSAHIISVRAAGRSLGLVVDSGEEVYTVPWKAVCRPGDLEPRVPYALGVVQRPDGPVLVVDVDALVTHDEWSGVVHAIDAGS